jgi:hypothetical protein
MHVTIAEEQDTTGKYLKTETRGDTMPCFRLKTIGHGEKNSDHRDT